jgi:hypothetical protein
MQVPDYASEPTMTDPVSSAVQVPNLALGAAAAAYRSTADQARDEEWAVRLFDRDVSLWTSDAAVGRSIAERLGWLDAPVDILRERTSRRDTRPLLRTPDPKATLARLDEERRASYAEAHIHIRSGIQGHGEVVDKIIKALQKHLSA